jgi:ABC-type lipoprotein release transport system permease subunit
MSRAFLYYLFLIFYKEKRVHFGIVLISTILIFLISSTLFVSSSLKTTLFSELDNQADFVIQRVKGDRLVDAPLSWQDKVEEIYGVSKVTPRVYGRYFFEDKKEYALIVGVDFLEEQSSKELEALTKDLNLKEFLADKNMVVGAGVKEYLKSHFYSKDYSFLNTKGEFIKVKIYKTLNKNSSLFSNNLIIVPIDLAREILGVDEDYVTDFMLNVPNDDERDNVYTKLSSLYFDILVTSKKDIKKGYENLFNYKGGFFMVLFLLSLVTFILILYYRYTIIFYSQKRVIGIYRAIGWSIKDIIKLKTLESFMIVIVAFIIGVSLGYIYTFIFDAPLIKSIFIGSSNLVDYGKLEPVVDFRVISSIFLLFATPFMAASIVPVWKIAITNPKEAMR